MSMFLSNVMLAGKQVAILYIIVIIGAVADKCGVYPEKIAKGCTDLLFYVVTPAMILQSFFAIDGEGKIKELLIAFGCGMLMHTIYAVISALVFRKCPKDRSCIFKYACAYGNCGYMALPLANAVLGAEGVLFCSAVVVSFQIFSFTHGIYLMNIGKENGKTKIDLKRLILNPGVLPVLAGLPILAFSIKLPDIISQPISYIASLNTPVAMLIFGTFIANTDFKSLFKEWRIFGVSLIKLIISPLLMLGLYMLLGIRSTLLVALVLSASAPTANNTVMFAAKYDRNTGLASQTVAAVSFISVITMPVMIALAQSLG